MNRHVWNGLAATACCLSTCAAPVYAADRPNILVVVSEDNGPELGCYGDSFARTPVLDRLAREGARFDRAYVPQAGCSQSRAAFLTGLYPHQNGQIGLATWNFRMYREETPNLVERLKAAGYRTGIIGKLHVNPEAAFPFDFKSAPGRGSNFKREELSEYAVSASTFFAKSDRPFFLSVNYPDAHRPFKTQVDGLPRDPLKSNDVRPLSYIGLDSVGLRVQTADYYNSLSRLDSLIGDLLLELEKCGKAKNTLIVYFGDHGADLLRGKRTSYEGGVRIPLIIHGPRRVTAGQVRHELVSTLDLVPTLLEVAGADRIPGLPGESLWPLLRDEKPRWRTHLYTEFHLHSAHDYYPQRTVRDDRFKLIQSLLPGEPNPGYEHTLTLVGTDVEVAVRQSSPIVRDAYSRMHYPHEFELYDLKDDPCEFHNLAEDPDYAGVLAALKQELADWRQQTGDPLLVRGNVLRLKAEIDACFRNGRPNKQRLGLTYPEYFRPGRSDDGFTETALFRSGEGGYHTYRIPAIIASKAGSLLAFCEGRRTGSGDSGDIDLLLKRSEDGGNTWSATTVVWNDGDNTCGNPCPVVDEQTGIVHLLLTWNLGSDGGRPLHDGTARDTRRVFYCSSNDDGKSWSQPVEITGQAKHPDWQWYATGPGVGIQLKRGPRAGRLVVPCDHTTRAHRLNSHAIFSDDGGKSWQRSQPIGPTCNECQVVELSDGRLLMNMRSQEMSGASWASERPRNGYRSIACSSDGGQTWTDPVFDSHLGDPKCQAGLMRYDDTTLVFSNPSPEIRPGRGERIRMTVRASHDDGQTWPMARVVHEGPAAYSCPVRLPDGRIGLLYEGGQKSASEAIRLARFPVEWVSGGTVSDAKARPARLVEVD